MRACVQTIRVGIDDLKSYLSNAESESELIRLLLRNSRLPLLEDQERQLLTQIAAARTDRKRYLYCVAVVSLYGLLERFVDSLVEAFVARVSCMVGTYEKMPGAIRNNHVSLSLELVKALTEDRHREALTPTAVIANLHSCLSGAEAFQVNGAAFVLHRGNISLRRVTTFLSSVGIDGHLRRVTHTRGFMEFSRAREPERDVRSVADPDLHGLLQPIDDLVERRNQVAHGVIDDIESVELLKERCQFVATYAAALYDVFAQEVLRYEVERPTAQRLGKPLAVFNRQIVCFESSQCTIAVGNVLVAATGKSMEPFRHGAILSLEVDHVRYGELAISQPTQFGVLVPYRARPEYEYFLLPSDIV